MNRNFERIYYLLLIMSLQTGYVFIRILILLSPLLKTQTPKKDLILFPYAQRGSTGYYQRFEIYFSFLNEDKVKYNVQDVFNDDYILEQIYGSVKSRYNIYRKIFWKRIFQILKSRNYKSAFYQRHLFPFFPDRKNALLEKLLFKLNSKVTVDYWDSDWVRNPETINILTSKYVHQISCINTFIYEHFNNTKAHKLIFPMGVKVDNYIQKKDFNIDLKEVKVFYTGSIDNVKQFFNITQKSLRRLSQEFIIKIIIVSREEYYIEGLDIEYHKFSHKTFFDIMSSCDIGLYAMEDTEIGRGKMAMKTLDYWASGLPSVVSETGLSPYANNEYNCLVTENISDFYAKIKLLITDNQLRLSISENGLKTIREYHDIKKSYQVFKSIILN